MTTRWQRHPRRGRAPAHHLGRRPHPRATRPVAARAAGAACATAGPRVVREKVKLEFKGGHYGFTSATPTTATGATSGCSTTSSCRPACCTRRPASRASEQRNVPATLRGLPPGHLRPDGAARRHGREPRRGGDQLPEHLPPLLRAGLPRARGQGPRARVPADLQRLDDRRVVRRRRQGPPDPADARPAVGSAARGRRGAALRGEGQPRHRLQREPVEARAARRSTRASGTCCGRPARRPRRRCRCTSARRRRCRRRRPTRRWRPRCRCTPRTPRARCATGSSPARWRASPSSRSPTPRARSAGCRSSSSGWTACGATASAASSCPTAPSEQVRGRVFGCVFDDLVGLRYRDEVGLEPILFETDYPHSDGTFPHSRKVAHEPVRGGGHGRRRVLRGAARQRDQRLRPRPLRHHQLKTYPACWATRPPRRGRRGDPPWLEHTWRRLSSRSGGRRGATVPPDADRVR